MPTAFQQRTVYYLGRQIHVTANLYPRVRGRHQFDVLTIQGVTGPGGFTETRWRLQNPAPVKPKPARASGIWPR